LFTNSSSSTLQQAFRAENTSTAQWNLNAPSEFNNEKIIQVACGSCHTVFLSESLTVYGVGYNYSHQIRGPKSSIPPPLPKSSSHGDDKENNDDENDEEKFDSVRPIFKPIVINSFVPRLHENEVIKRIGAVAFGSLFYTSHDRVLFAGKYTNLTKFYNYKNFTGISSSDYFDVCTDSDLHVRLVNNGGQSVLQVIKTVEDRRPKSSIDSEKDSTTDDDEPGFDDGDEEYKLFNEETIVKSIIVSKGFQIKYVACSTMHYCIALQCSTLFKNFNNNSRKMVDCDMVVKFTL